MKIADQIKLDSETLSNKAQIEKYLDFFEGLLEGYDWLGTGSDSRYADKEEADAWEMWRALRELIKNNVYVTR
jgi:hypothetical protein